MNQILKHESLEIVKDFLSKFLSIEKSMAFSHISNVTQEDGCICEGRAYQTECKFSEPEGLEEEWLCKQPFYLEMEGVKREGRPKPKQKRGNHLPPIPKLEEDVRSFIHLRNISYEGKVIFTEAKIPNKKRWHNLHIPGNKFKVKCSISVDEDELVPKNTISQILFCSKKDLIMKGSFYESIYKKDLEKSFKKMYADGELNGKNLKRAEKMLEEVFSKVGHHCLGDELEFGEKKAIDMYNKNPYLERKDFHNIGTPFPLSNDQAEKYDLPFLVPHPIKNVGERLKIVWLNIPRII